MKKYYLFKYVSVLILSFTFFSLGYADSPTIKEVSEGFTLDQYNRLTVIGLPISLERKFIKNYKKHFPDVTFIEKKRITEAVKEEDLRLSRLDDKTRTTLRKAFDLDAIVFGQCIDCGTLDVLPVLKIGIMDIETGEIVGHVTTARVRLDQMSEAINDAISALK